MLLNFFSSPTEKENKLEGLRMVSYVASLILDSKFSFFFSSFLILYNLNGGLHFNGGFKPLDANIRLTKIDFP